MHKPTSPLIWGCAFLVILGTIPVLAQTIIYVDASATGSNSGLDWANAHTDMQSALSRAQNEDQIWVAAGVYKPTTGTSRTTSFVMKQGVALYGGFSGEEDPATFDLADRDFDANETILSGDIGTPEDSSDNSYHVVVGANDAILDGFTITGGNASGSSTNGYGGGMYNFSNSPTVVNCVFIDNRANFFGGGMYNRSNSATVINCTFIENITMGAPSTFGGGMFNHLSNPVITDSVFINNIAMAVGGGMANLSSNPTITRCTFTENSSDRGGGIYNGTSSNAIIINSVFQSNKGSLGGGIYNQQSSPMVINSVFSDNMVVFGGGIYNNQSNPTIINCTIADNSSPYGAGMAFESSQQSNPSTAILTNNIIWDGEYWLWNFDNSTLTVTYSNIQSGWPGAGNINVDPLFIDPDNGNLRLHPFSLCIDAGDNAAVPLDVTTDPDGNPRVVDGIDDGFDVVDMGAYEYQPSTSTMVTISGSIDLQDYLGDVTTIPVTIEIRILGLIDPLETHVVNLAIDGSYSFETELSGEYDIAAKGPKWLRQVHSSVDTTDGAIVNFYLINGDANDDNGIGFHDINLVIHNFGKISNDPDWDARADINGDGTIDILDIGIVVDNFGKLGHN